LNRNMVDHWRMMRTLDTLDLEGLRNTIEILKRIDFFFYFFTLKNRKVNFHMRT
jgi:hypothetical protein